VDEDEEEENDNFEEKNDENGTQPHGSVKYVLGWCRQLSPIVVFAHLLFIGSYLTGQKRIWSGDIWLCKHNRQLYRLG
jgi:hypothetical protein